MKYLAASILLSSIFFFSCEKKASYTADVNTIDSTKKVNRFATDSVWIHDSLKVTENLTVTFKNKLLVFNEIKDRSVLDSIYSVRNISLSEYSKENLTTALNKKKEEYYTETKESLADWSPEFPQTWDQVSDMKIFSTQDDFLTVQYKNHGYTGGAHGYYNEIYKVFDLKSNKTLQLSDIVKNQDAKIWSKILMSNFLKNDLERNQAQMLLVDEIPLNSNFYFDREHLYFLYNQYEIAAYAAGTILIKVPFTEIKPLLNEDFRTKLNLK